MKIEKTNCPGMLPKITVKVSRKSSTQEWVVRSRNEGKLTGEYFTDDKDDALATAEAIYDDYVEKGFASALLR